MAAASTTASATSLASAQRHRPKPWVQANRKVPVSSSRASTGAPANAPISTGTNCRKTPPGVVAPAQVVQGELCQAGLAVGGEQVIDFPG